jgi:ubiquinone/menaquinone biosynthesis C-methylase UbiE
MNLKSLAPFVAKVIGVDISDNMIAEFNRNASSLGLSDKVVGYQADLLAEDAPAQDIESACTNLDLVTVSMALHHFEHPDRALKRLAKRLNKGGACYIIDLVAHSGAHGHGHDDHQHEFAGAAHTVKTHGFSHEDMQQLFEGAGLTIGFEYKILPEPLRFSTEERSFSKTVFIARAQLK